MKQATSVWVRERYCVLYRFIDNCQPRLVDYIEMPNWLASIEFEIRSELVSISPNEVRIIHASR